MQWHGSSTSRGPSRSHLPLLSWPCSMSTIALRMNMPLIWPVLYGEAKNVAKEAHLSGPFGIGNKL